MGVFEDTLARLIAMPQVQEMKKYPQHRGTNSFDHSIAVAVAAHHLAARLGWRVDEEALAVGGMLHDYYLHRIVDEGHVRADWRHGVNHPREALTNAERDFVLTPKEANIIRSHMWTLTLWHIPRSREAWLIDVADDYVAARELRVHRHKKDA